MTTIMPQSELTKRAVAWISEELKANQGKSLAALIEDAAMRFNLGPKDVELLQQFFQNNRTSALR